jgi:hypothetical protein
MSGGADGTAVQKLPGEPAKCTAGKVFILDKLSEIPYNSLLQFQWLQARSSGGERYLDTVEVGGSKPPGPTMIALLYGYPSMSSIL